LDRNWNCAAGKEEGGRLPTPDFIFALADYMKEKQPVKTLQQSGLVDRTLIYDNNGQGPKLLSDSEKSKKSSNKVTYANSQAPVHYGK
jgi:hypothetical protein